MAIWTPLIKEYFCRFNEGTAVDIMKWITDNKRQVVYDYIQSHIDLQLSRGPTKDELIIKSMASPKFVFNIPWGGVDRRYRMLMKVSTLSPILTELFKKGIIERKEIHGLVKWKYYNK